MAWLATIALDHAGTGIYRGSLTVPISGTYIASVSVQQSGFRSEGDSAVFVVGEPSRLMPSFGGRPTLNASTPVTVTLRNERGMPVPGASVIISGTHEYYSKTSDAFGQVAVSLRPATVDPYWVMLTASGYAQTVLRLPVWVAPDTEPPLLLLDLPGITNHTPLSPRGKTEPGARVTVNGEAILVDSRGYFTPTVNLSEGSNPIVTQAVDTAGNSTNLPRTVVLDTAPPALTITYPPII